MWPDEPNINVWWLEKSNYQYLEILVTQVFKLFMILQEKQQHVY
jgi:hypothetical protein